MNERLRKLRKHLDMTQQEFGANICVKGNTVAQWESGRNEPSDSAITLICREFNVNEKWLRTGEGEMFIEIARDEQIASFVGGILKDEEETFKKRFISMLSALDESDWESLKKMIDLLQEKRD